MLRASGRVDGLGRAVRRSAAAVLAAFAALALAYNAVVPIFEGADESSHYFVARHIARTASLPVQRAAAADRGPWEQEGSQPPLYYLLAAPLVRLSGADLDGPEPRVNDQNSMGRPAVIGNENRFVHDPAREGWPWRGEALAVHLGRLLSTLLGLVALIALGSIFGRVFRAASTPSDAPYPWLAVAALALVALNPQFIHLASTMSNDNAMNAAAAVALALLLRVLDDDRPPRRRDTAALALAVGVAPLAKITGVPLAAFVVATLLWTAWRRRAAGANDRARRLVGTAAAVVIACAALSGWWYLRNVRLYGSLTGLNIMLPPELRRDWNAARFLRGLPGELNGLWLSSWGLFGWFTVLMPGWVYALIDIAAVTAVVGNLLPRPRRAPSPHTPPPALGEGSAREARRGRGPSRANPDRRLPRALLLLAAWWLVAFASLLRWMMIAKGAHGRLLFPAIAAPAALLVLGWRAVVPVRRVGDRALALAVAGAMALLAIGALVGVIRPAYARPATIAASALPADAVPIGVVFDGAVELVAMKAPRRVVEGAAVDVTLYWRVGATAGASRDGFVALRWDQEVASAKAPDFGRTTSSSPPDLSYPGRGNAPFASLAGTAGLVADERTVRAPTLATVPDWDGYRPSTLARLVVDVYDMRSSESWPAAPAAVGGPANAAVDVAIDAAARQPRRDEALAPRTAAARFGDAVALDVREWPAEGPPRYPTLPLALPSRVAPPGILAFVALVWRALAAPAEDLQMFVHLAGPRDAEPIPLDGPPAADGRYPTGWWRPGDRVPVRLEVPRPAAARAGDRYTLRLGLYRLAPGTPRLPAVDAAGHRWPDDAVTVAEITVR